MMEDTSNKSQQSTGVSDGNVSCNEDSPLPERLSAKETLLVNRSKWLVYLFLFAAGMAMSWCSFVFLSKEDEKHTMDAEVRGEI
jgi:hypothetical protein